jgi:parvulin-like peptidyl-prolyl isomerase
MPLIINSQAIDPGLIEQEFSSIKSYYERTSQVSCCERDPEFLAYAKENITARVLLNQEAERNGALPSEDEVNEAVAKLKEEHGGEDEFYMKAGITRDQEELVQKDVQASLRVDKFLEEKLGSNIDPNEDEMRAFYEENIKEFMTVEEVSASHLFKSLSQAESRSGLYEEMREFRRRALAGEDFEAMAKANTDKEEKDVELGYFKQGELMDEFEVIAFSLEVGDLTPVFSSHWGFHLAKITGRKPSEPEPFDSVQDEIRELMIAEDRQEKTKVLVESLKATAEIDDSDDDGDESAECAGP